MANDTGMVVLYHRVGGGTWLSRFCSPPSRITQVAYLIITIIIIIIVFVVVVAFLCHCVCCQFCCRRFGIIIIIISSLINILFL